MKKIAVWKVILLSIVTLGIYSVVWVARRRNELVKQYGLKLPHWKWVVVPPLVSFILLILIILISFTGEDAKLVFWTIVAASTILSLTPYIITLWWIVCFGKAVAKVTAGRVPAVWTGLLYFFWSPVVIMGVHQYYFNRFPVKEIPAKSSFVKPSRKFIILSTVSIVISLGINLFSVIATPPDYTKLKQLVDNQTGYVQKANALAREYDACMTQLEVDFPDGPTAENEVQYKQNHNACEDIRIKLSNAAPNNN